MPYLIGPNSVALTPKRDKTANQSGIECSQKPMTPSAETAISTSFTCRATIDLSKRSASCPPRPERKKNGPMNTAAVSVISASRFPTPGANRIRKTSAFLRKLSLNAEKNWHQNSGAKRRVASKDDDMGSPVLRPGQDGPAAGCQRACAGKDDNLGERTIGPAGWRNSSS